MKRLSSPVILSILFLTLLLGLFFQNPGTADSGCRSTDVFKNQPLTGFWDENFVELQITEKGWELYKVDKFKKTKKLQDKGLFAAFINYIGKNKDFTMLNLYYDRKDILDDTPYLKLQVSYKKNCLWSKKNNFKVCLK